MPTKLTYQEFIDRSIEIHGLKFDYSKVIYVNNKTLIEIICQKHGGFWQIPQNHLKGSGCAKCEDFNRRKTLENFIIESINLHGNKYDYTCSVYVSANSKIKIVCPRHGSFYQTPAKHLGGKGYGCPVCFKEAISYSNEEFIKLSNIEHDFGYNYDYVNYINSQVEVMIWCYDYNFYFFQKPAVHLFGHGCPKCGEDSKKLNLKDFIDRSNIVHNNKYDYSLVEYCNSYTKVKIKCKRHSLIFNQTPFGHLHGRGCVKCAIAFPKLEDKWLDFVGVAEENKRQIVRVCNKIYKVDGFDPENNTVYEFYGDFWHGNPVVFNSNDVNIVNNKTFGILYENTLKREKCLREAGYNIISIWESSFKALLKQ